MRQSLVVLGPDGNVPISRVRSGQGTASGNRSLSNLVHGLHQLLTRVPLLVTFMEQLRANDPLFIDDKSRGVWNAGKTSGRLLVANAVGVNRLAPLIGEKRESDLMLRRGTLQRRGRVVADAYQ